MTAIAMRVRVLRRTAVARGPRWLALQALLTAGAALVAASVLIPAVHWALESARWGVVAANLRLYALGTYPLDQVWRAVAAAALTLGLLGASTAAYGRAARDAALVAGGLLVLLLVAPLTAPALEAVGTSGLGTIAAATAGGRQSLLVLLTALLIGALGGHLLGQRVAERKLARRFLILWLLAPVVSIVLLSAPLAPTGAESSSVARALSRGVSPADWGGLLLTLILAVVSIGVSFVFGLALALGRRSPLPLVKALSVGYIELIRGVPLVTVLFMALVMAPLVLPDGPWLELAFRAMVGFILFAAAYVAEDIRGGLAAVGRGQYEAAHALGLGTVATYRFVVLPQALRIVMPALVGQFISLFKDTALVGILGLNELLGIALAVVGQPEWQGHLRESLIFVAIIYFVFSHVMARTSRRLEVRQ
jgi:general L-amino acid transport system permease protein